MLGLSRVIDVSPDEGCDHSNKDAAMLLQELIKSDKLVEYPKPE